MKKARRVPKSAKVTVVVDCYYCNKEISATVDMSDVWVDVTSCDCCGEQTDIYCDVYCDDCRLSTEACIR